MHYFHIWRFNLLRSVKSLIWELGFITAITFIYHSSLLPSYLMYKYFYFSSTSNTRFGVPTKPVGIVYVKFQNSKSLADPHISLSTSINTEGGTDTYLIVE